MYNKKSTLQITQVVPMNLDNSSGPSEQSQNEDQSIQEEDLMKILVASDINLGYERTVKRDEQEESFNTFEEILKYAKANEVDAIFLAGNLFYESNPSLDILTKCVNLLRTYCLDQKPVKIECCTDPEWIFKHYTSHKTVNFADENLNIGLPIFSIYGHRDSPLFGSVGPLDLLAATGLINYFGKWSINPKISIPPLLLRKGSTTIALYGLNHMNNEKLCTLIECDEFELLEDYTFDAFSIMILHQARKVCNNSAQRFVSEALLPDFLDLVIWGNEPKNHLELEPPPNKNFGVYQLGSTIATSLLEKDANQKKVAILKVYRNQLLEITNYPLRTVRPFIFKHLKLAEHDDTIEELLKQLKGPVSKTRSLAVERFVDKYIAEVLLPEACKQKSGHSKQPEMPILRLKISFDEEENCFNLLRLCKKYQDRVANPNSMIWFSKCPSIPEDLEMEISNESDDEFSEIFFKNDSKNWSRTVESGIAEHFNTEDNRDELTVLNVDRLNEALSLFRKGNNNIFETTVRKDIKRAVQDLLNSD